MALTPSELRRRKMNLLMAMSYATFASTKNVFTPLSLFAAGEQGVWYDPSDFSTMFQDSAGTTPVTAVEQPVGLILDKSKGLALGADVKSSGVVGLVGAATAATYNTTTGEGTVARVDASNQSYVQWTGLSASALYKMTVACTSGTIIVRTGIFSGTQIASVASGNTVTMYALTDGSGRITITNTTSAGSAAFTVTAFALAFGNHASQSTAASRPVLRQEATGEYYLAFDGTDDSLATASIDFSATDKMSVFAGVRKLSDAAIGSIVELSANVNTNAGGFWLAGPVTVSGPNIYVTSGGTVLSAGAIASSLAAPVTVIASGLGNISGDSVVARINGVQAANSGSDQGTGNYGNYPIYIGRRGGASIPFNGRLYSLIVRGAQSTDAQIASAEAWVNQRTRAF